MNIIKPLYGADVSCCKAHSVPYPFFYYLHNIRKAHIGSWKLIRHPSWDSFAPVNSTGCGVPPPRPPVAYTCCVSVLPSMHLEDRTDKFATD